MLATKLERWDDAETHLERALELEQRQLRPLDLRVGRQRPPGGRFELRDRLPGTHPRGRVARHGGGGVEHPTTARRQAL